MQNPKNSAPEPIGDDYEYASDSSLVTEQDLESIRQDEQRQRAQKECIDGKPD